jgi:hypothetical protein
MSRAYKELLWRPRFVGQTTTAPPQDGRHFAQQNGGMVTSEKTAISHPEQFLIRSKIYVQSNVECLTNFPQSTIGSCFSFFFLFDGNSQIGMVVTLRDVDGLLTGDRTSKPVLLFLRNVSAAKRWRANCFP